MMLLLLITAPKLHCFYFLHITLCFFYSCFYPHISVIHMHIYHGMRARGNLAIPLLTMFIRSHVCEREQYNSCRIGYSGERSHVKQY